MRTAAAHSQEIHKQVEAFRLTLCAGLRYAPCVLLVLLIGVLNPTLCLLHCAITHRLEAAQGTSIAHQHHSQHADTGSAHSLAACAAGLPDTDHLIPRAVYELALVGLVLVGQALAAVARTPRAPWRLRTAHPPQPPTPPPQLLACA